VIRRRHAIALAVAAWAGDDAPAARAQSLGLASGEVLRGRFTQQRFLQGFNAPLTSSGSFIVAPGRGIVWHGEAPFAIVTVMGAGGLVQRVAGGATTHYPASRLPAIARLYEIFAAALSGDWQKLAAVFDVRRDGTPNDWTATLTPLRGGEGGISLRLVAVRGGRYVDSVEVTRANGDRDHIDFSQQAPSRSPIDAESSELLDTAGRP
jgi:Outer membrane lipoprotein carrier protein LolA-like